MAQYILYTRVSTKRQGLGLEAQRTTAMDFIARNGGKIVAEYSEKESGKINERPQLMEALAHCKRIGATLLIAKLDRLSRNGAFLVSLKDSGINFRAVDLPDFNTMTLYIFAGLAQQEREMISERTKKALSELKAKGVKLGAPGATITNEMRSAALASRRDSARNNEHNKRAWALVSLCKGLPFAAIASKLNEAGFTTAKGGQWSAVQIQRLEKLMTE